MHKYFKFVFPEGVGNLGVIMIAEVELLDGNVDQTTPSSPVTATGYYGSAYPSNVVDNSVDITSKWQINFYLPIWLQIELAAPAKIQRYRIRACEQPQYTPAGWYLYASADGLVWDEIGSEIGQTDWGAGDWRLFTTTQETKASGTIVDGMGSPVRRVVRAYNRSTGELLGETVSSQITGYYELPVGSTGEIQIVMLDDALGILENDQILRTITP